MEENSEFSVRMEEIDLELEGAAPINEEDIEENQEDKLESEEVPPVEESPQINEFSEDQIKESIENVPEDSTDKSKEKIPKSKDFIREMRNLLNNYPMKINFREGEDTLSVVGNLLLTHDLLIYCKNKTNDEVVKAKFQEEINEIDKNLDLKRFRELYRKAINRKINFNYHSIMAKLEDILTENSDFIYDKFQYYILAIPQKGKFNMHVGTAHGLPAAFAEDYEQEEIESGASLKEDSTFKLDEEGKVIPLE